MDAYINLITLRAVRAYSDRAIGAESVEHILEAGRATGSSRNSQPWTFHVVKPEAQRSSLAEGVFAPSNVNACQVAIAIVMKKSGFDSGRVAQNMMLAAWAEGIGSTPNGVRDPDKVAEVLGLGPDLVAATILTFGYPVEPVPVATGAAGVLARIDRKPLSDLVVYVE